MNTHDVFTQIPAALEALGLPQLVTREDIKKRYRQLAREHHPDRTGLDEAMERINAAYALLMEYIDTFRYRFDAAEIAQHYPERDHAQKFKF
jgi:DnaJ-class molecular chaperone